MILKIPNAEVQEFLSGKKITYPKYVTQLLVLANQNAQGTRAKVVGQMSDLIQEFEGQTQAEWEKWYSEGHPDAIDKATDKIYEMVLALKETIQNIDRDTVKMWVEEFIYIKTFAGLKFQEAILRKVADNLQLPYKLADPADESKGIDGYIGGKPASVKPDSYKLQKQLSEEILVPIIFYEKAKNDIIIEFEPADFQ